MEHEELWAIFGRCYKVWPDLPSQILNVYLWGSRVYGLAGPTSDWDFFVVVKEAPNKEEGEQEIEKGKEKEDENINFDKGGFTVEGGYGDFGIRPQGVPKETLGMLDKTFFVIDDGVCNAKFVPLSHFKAMILELQHEALEVIFLPPQYKLKEDYRCEYELDFDVLRRTIAWESKRRFQCASHTATKSFRNAKKEIVHSLRYMLFALQVAKQGKIEDYGCANKYYHEIMAETATDWKFYAEKYELYRKAISAELAASCHFENFYGRLETKRVALEHLRRMKRCEIGFKINEEGRALGHSPLASAGECPYPQQQTALIRFLCENGVQRLQAMHSVSVSSHTKHKELLFIRTNHYHAVESEIEKECYNGILIEGSYPFKIISYSLPYFATYNHPTNSPPSFSNEWGSSVRVYEKIDGTFGCMYRYGGEWHIASRFEANDPSAPMCWKEEYSGASHECKLGDLFWRVWNERGYQLPNPDEHMCYMFHLITPKHRYVTKPSREDILLIGARSLDTLDEIAPEELVDKSKLNWTTVRPIDSFESYQELSEFVKDHVNPFKTAGYVLWDRVAGQRVSVLSERFVSIAYGSEFASMGSFNMVGEMDEKQMLEMMKGNKAVHPFLDYFPEWRDYHAQLAQHYNALCEMMQRDYDKLLEGSKGDVGRYCKAAKGTGVWQGNLLINMRLGHHLSIREYLALLDPKSKLGFYRLYKKYIAEKADSPINK